MDVPGAILLKQANHDWGVAQQVSPCRPASGCEAKRTSNQYASGDRNRRVQGGSVTKPCARNRRADMELRPQAFIDLGAGTTPRVTEPGQTVNHGARVTRIAGGASQHRDYPTALTHAPRSLMR